MKDNTFFDEKITDAAEIQIDIRDVHKKRQKDIGGLFKKIFREKPKVFKMISNFLFYKPGRPKADTKAKLPDMLENFITVVKWYEFIGKKPEIDRILANHGLTLTSTAIPITSALNNVDLQDDWDDIMGTVLPANDLDIFNALLKESHSSIGAVHTLNSEIDEMAPDVETKCGVGISIFKKSAKLKAKKLDGTDISEKVKDIENQADQMSEALSRL